MTTLYGIKNCDTVKRARLWLDRHGIVYSFHDFRSDGISRVQVAAWMAELGWETLLNQKSTSWKNLTQNQRDVMDNDAAIDAIMETPTLIKRPLLDTGSERHVGFKETYYTILFTRHTL